jgi:hypothetical protein
MLLKNYLNSTHPSLSRDNFFSNIDPLWKIREGH